MKHAELLSHLRRPSLMELAKAPIMPDVGPNDVKDAGKGLSIGPSTKVVIPSQGDYVIVWQEKGKSVKTLAVVDEVKDGVMRVVLEKGRERKETTVKANYPLYQLIANLGPRPGKINAFGVSVNPWIRNIETPSGTLMLWTELDDATEKVLLSCMEQVRKQFESLGFGWLFPIDYPVQEPSGQFWASYDPVDGKLPDGTAMLDTVLLKLPEWKQSSLVPLLRHEYSHGLDFRGMDAKTRGQWVSEYHHYVSVSSGSDLLGKVKEAFFAKGRDYAPKPDSNEMQVWDEVQSFLQNEQHLRMEDVFTLIDAGQKDEVSKSWPKNADLNSIRTGEMPTRYSASSPTEFWAECSMLHLGNELKDAHLQALVEQTYKVLKGHSKKPSTPPQGKDGNDG